MKVARLFEIDKKNIGKDNPTTPYQQRYVKEMKNIFANKFEFLTR